MLILYSVIVLLIILLLFLCIHLFLLKKEIRHISFQFSNIMQESTNAHITKEYIDKDIEQLIQTINQFIDQTKQIEMKSKESNEILKSTILNMSHDIRTPLTSIQGYLQLINMEEVDNQKRREYIKIVETRIETLKNMMESFFELAKVESNSFPIELNIINTYDVLIDILGMYYDVFQEKHISLDLDINENTYIIADEKALKRIFNNLISNIVKHGCQKATIKNEIKDNELIYIFKNNTFDINDENVVKLFDKFYTTSNSRTEKSSGLGLAITKELVSKLNGKIEVNYIENEISFVLKFKLYKNIDIQDGK